MTGSWERPRAAAFAAGLAVVAWAAAIGWVSHSASAALAKLVGLEIVGGVLALIALPRIARAAPLWWIALCGALAHAALLPAEAGLEDYYRYLWDGAVAAHGMNPWAYSPSEVQAGSIPAPLQELALQAGVVLERVSHPQLPTIYPPSAQAVFAAAHLAFPWSVPGWRAVLLLFNGATFWLVMLLLRALGKPEGLAAWYWWNPVLLLEVALRGHLEPLVLVPATAAVLLAVRRRYLGAAALVAVATATKVWPVLLLPILLRPLVGKPRRLALAVAVFLALTVAAWLPLVVAGPAGLGGFLAYGRTWENNDGFFRALVAAARVGLPVCGLHPGHAQAVARGLTAALLAAWLARLLGPPLTEGLDLVRRSLWALAALFLLGPTQFPWYFLWMLPLLAAFPRGPLLAYVALLPLYYLHYRWPWVLWLEHLPVWLWLAFEAGRRLPAFRRLSAR